MIDINELPYPASGAGLFSKLRHLPYPMLLQSGRVNRHSRYDIMVAAPDKMLQSKGQETLISIEAAPVRRVPGHPLDVLAQELDLQDEETSDLPFSGGAVGFLAYELGQQELLRVAGGERALSSVPDMLIGIYSWALLLDHEQQRCLLVFRQQCSADKRALITAALTSAASAKTESSAFTLLEPFSSNFSKPAYLQAYTRIMDYIHAGDCYQVNLAQCFSAPCQGDTYSAFCRLQAKAQAPFAAYIEADELALMSFSPERFLQVRDGQVLTQPIKGTRPRQSDPDADSKMRSELGASLKDRAENLMIVDLLRNDLGRVCKTGSVSVSKLFDIESFPNVHHLVSSIHGELAQKADVFALLKACFPGGSITGTPKIRAMEIIRELEAMPRSVYCGSVLHIGFDGNMDSSISIRTLLRENDSIHCWGGGGIVADSDGAQEYQETLDKISLFLGELQTMETT